MRKGFIRQVNAFFLMFAFLLGATAIVPLNVSAQTTDNKTTKEEKKNKKEKPKTEKQTAALQTDGKKALSPNEDPSMIGKRNINSGGDKIWGWLGGSREKEIQLGRQ